MSNVKKKVSESENVEGTKWDILTQEPDFYDRNNNTMRDHLETTSNGEYLNPIKDVYSPSDEFTEKRLEGAKMNLVNMLPKISEIVKKFEADGDLADYVADLANISVEAFKIQRVPDLEIVSSIDGIDNKMGGYNNARNKIYIQESAMKPMRLANIITHEFWHAHQYENRDSDMLYRMNIDMYVDGAEDMVAYRKQLIEKESYSIGDYFEEIIENV